MTLETKRISTDVLIIGGGGAGAMAAIKAMAQGADVRVVTKGPFPSGNTSIALGGFAVALGHSDPRDNPQVHFEDVVSGGQGLCNQKLVRTWVTKIVEIAKEMDSWGIGLVKEGEKFSQIPWEAHTYPRMIHHYWTTGKPVRRCLSEKSKAMGIQALENTIIGGLLKGDDGAVAGAWGIEYQTGQLFFAHAKAVVLATGGMGHLFPMTDNFRTITGEGYALAFRSGAELIGMEMTHFLPFVCYPEAMQTRRTVIRAVQALLNKGGARLYNGLGERFMKKHHPETGERQQTNEHLTRHIGLEICEGRASAHGGVYLDISDVPADLQKEILSDRWDKAKRSGIDLSFQPIELAPSPHDFLGGVKIDETGSTTVEGLYAAGEVAGGAHGAARLGGSAVSDALSFGAIAGTNAAHYAGRIGKESSKDEQQIQEIRRGIETLVSKENGIDPSEAVKRIQSIANNYLNVVRSEKGLKKALQKLEHMEREVMPQMTARAEDPKERAFNLRKAIEADGQLELCKIIATAALYRKESRGGSYGGHYRSDYPDQDDDKWLKNIILKREKSAISLRKASPVMEA